MAGMLGSIALMSVLAWIEHRPRLIWNASASLPIGLYRAEPASEIAVGEIVLITPPEALARFLTGRGHLPPGVPLLKRVLAFPGATVCRVGDHITVDGVAHGQAQQRDRHGRKLPFWQGCRVLADGEVFVMNRDAADSLDGRYFGPLPAASIVARAVPVWTFGDTTAARAHRLSSERAAEQSPFPSTIPNQQKE